jgi:hypothetical protein
MAGGAPAERATAGECSHCHTGWRRPWLRHRLAHGTLRDVLRGLWSTPGWQVLTTAFVERLNATFHARLAPQVRRTRALARLPERLMQGMQVVGASSTFCRLHTRLTTAEGVRQTPAIAAGSTDQSWSMRELRLTCYLLYWIIFPLCRMKK